MNNKVLNAMYNVASKMKVEGSEIQVISNTEIKYKRNDIYMSVGEIVIDMTIKYDESKGMIYFICETDNTVRNEMTIDKLLNNWYDESVVAPELKNNSVKYIVEVQTGGSSIKAFDSLIDAEIHYNDNLKYNPIKYTLIPFEMDNKLYYYSSNSKCISLYNSNYTYITKLHITFKEFNIELIKNGLYNYLNEVTIF